MTISANLGKPLEDYVDELVKSGRFNSSSDVLREGLRLLKIKERHQAELDDALQEGLADVEAGRVIPADELLAYFEAKYAAPAKD
ncbi:type II toxin-antitoxin system ParD family antitoxin [Rhizobium sp. XQZ8]|uniref:type II toxin-antitoxin system ParD family antitoxin n=1 Tax=Rhizobium populisoli TaxID=2859785 RepID=UPI001CA4941C|nr:type II toxin-antitoxin system ParD family antitoxin [Rhizobium populisoli]MBW6421194.1 type II toxin-antitoxin system ParD family antitoxin [Rhizobium populisoli]